MDACFATNSLRRPSRDSRGHGRANPSASRLPASAAAEKYGSRKDKGGIALLGIRRGRSFIVAAIATACLIGIAVSAQPAGASAQQMHARFELVSSAGQSVAPPGFDICSQSAKDHVPVEERFDWCDAVTGYVWTYNSNGTITGTATISITFYGLWGPSSRVWQVSQGFSEVGCTGILCGAQIYILGLSTCSATCTFNYNQGYKILIPPPPAGDSIATGVVSFGTATTSSIVTTTLSASTPAGPAVGTISETTTEVRCDSNPLGQTWSEGCVTASYIPTYGLSKSRYPDIYAFDLNQVANNPQWVELSRTVIQSVINANRAAACKGFVKKNATDSCDEFPYASTYQGGLGPPPAAQEHVPSTENSGQGGNLGQFYTSNRLLNGDKFYMSFVP